MSTILGTQVLSTLAGLDLSLAQTKENYLEAVDAENYYVMAIDSAQLSTTIYRDALLLDPTNSALITLMAANGSVISSFSTALYSTHKQRMTLQSTQSTIQTIMTQAQLQGIDDLIRQTQDAITQDILNERTIISTINGISTSIRQMLIDEQKLYSTINVLSSQYLFSINTNSSLDGIIGQYLNLETSISSQLQTTLANISTYQYLSTQDAISSMVYYSTLSYYSTLDISILSSITGYSLELSSIMYQISTIDSSTLNAKGVLAGKYVQFKADADNYYVYKAADTDALMSQYIYAVKVYNQNAGKCAADLLIKKIDNLNLMDALYFQTLNPALDPALMKGYNDQRYGLMQTNITIDNYVLNVLNPLERMFYDLTNMAYNESTLKAAFIAQRQAIFDSYEYPCLTGNITPSTLISTAYHTDFSTLNGIVTKINSQISDKNAKLGVINGVLTPGMKSGIQSVLIKDWFAGITTNPTTTAILQEPITGSTITEYGIIPPIPV